MTERESNRSITSGRKKEGDDRVKGKISTETPTVLKLKMWQKRN
mgnify:CR=1 FL=1